MNFLDAELAQSNGSIYVDTGDFRVKCPDDWRQFVSGEVGRPVVFGVRPSDLYDQAISPIVAPSPDNTVAMEVEVIEPMGAETVLYLNTGSDSLVASVDSATRATERGKLQVVFDVAKAHLFDKETERCIV